MGNPSFQAGDRLRLTIPRLRRARFRLPTSEVVRRPRLFEKRELARGICAGEPRIGALVRRRYARLVSRNGFSGCLQARAIQQMLAQRSPEPVTPVPYLRSEAHTSELQSLMRSSYAVFCLQKNNNTTT